MLLISNYAIFYYLLSQPTDRKLAKKANLPNAARISELNVFTLQVVINLPFIIADLVPSPRD